MLPNLPVLPIRVRPTRFETVESFVTRVQVANGITRGEWTSWFRRYVDALGLPPRTLPHDLVERVAGLDRGFFTRTASLLPKHDDGDTCLRCTTGLGNRYGCTRCSGGAYVGEEPHDGPRVCTRHSRWVGPGTLPDAQFQVDARTIRADRKYRRLRREGVLDAHRLAEILGCVDHWVEAEAPRDLDAAKRFTLAIDLASRVLRPSFLRKVSDVNTDVALRYDELSRAVHKVAEAGSIVLTDAIWLMLRTAAYGNAAPHTFGVLRAVGARDDRDYLTQLRTSTFPRGKHLHLVQFVTSTHGGTRFERYVNTKAVNDYVCALGHRFEAKTSSMLNALKSVGCGYCSNRRPLVGFNTLADTHPEVANGWHPTLNDELRPDQVVAGSMKVVAWICSEGHATWRSIKVRVRGDSCNVCRNREIRPDVNSIAITHPEVAAVWDWKRNESLRPDDVAATTNRAVWWRCSAGHSYRMGVRSRVIGGRCKVCHRKQAHTSTSLAVTHREVAKRWHPTRNGDLSPDDVLSGSARKVWWLCDKGHDYQAIIQVQTRGVGCGVCANYTVSEFNCMSITHPHLAREFSLEKNKGLSPDTVFAGTTRRLWWQCSRGHEWETSGHTRVRKSAGCPYCSNRRVQKGWNDLATTRPDLAAQWSAEKNGELAPTQVVAGTNKRIWWECSCGHVWIASGLDRSKGRGCSACARHKQKRRRNNYGRG